MTDEQIIKALECFKSEDCLGGQCPYFEQPGLCGKPMCSDVYDFIYRQKAEIERLKKELELSQKAPEITKVRYEISLDERNFIIKQAKSEAIKEFAEKLNQLVEELMPTLEIPFWKLKINTIVKEMTENNDKE